MLRAPELEDVGEVVVVVVEAQVSPEGDGTSPVDFGLVRQVVSPQWNFFSRSTVRIAAVSAFGSSV